MNKVLLFDEDIEHSSRSNKQTLERKIIQQREIRTISITSTLK